MRKLILSVSVSIVGLAIVVPGYAQGKIDRSYGDGGILDARPPGAASLFLVGIAAARNGDAFSLFTEGQCASVCSEHLYRFGASGHLDSGFGGGQGAFEFPTGRFQSTGLAVDSHGRPLIADFGHSEPIVRRLTRRGLPDPAFGRDGLARIDCPSCAYRSPRLLAASDGTLTVVLSRTISGPTGPTTGVEFTLIRLRTTGSLDRRFGKGGIARIRLRGASVGRLSLALAKGGGVYLAGSAGRAAHAPDYVARISVRGRLDSRFLLATQHSLRELRRLRSRQETLVSSIVVRRRGQIDLLGSVGAHRGFIARLKPNGRLLRKFGRRGQRRLPLPVVGSAALGAGGVTLAVSGTGAGLALMGILPGGRIDRSFGSPGEEIPGLVGHSKPAVVAQKGGKVLLLSQGDRSEPRAYHPAEPRFVRFLQGRR